MSRNRIDNLFQAVGSFVFVVLVSKWMLQDRIRWGMFSMFLIVCAVVLLVASRSLQRALARLGTLLRFNEQVEDGGKR